MKEQQGVKERILDTAARLFYDQGFQATGINQIIEEADIAKASLYQHFPSKDALLTEYLEIAVSDYFNDMTAYTDKFPPGKQRLLALFDYRRQLMEKRNYKGCAFVRVAYELPDLDPAALAHIRVHKQRLKSFIETQLRVIRHPYPKTELKDMTEILFSLSEGASLQGTLNRSSVPMEDARKIVQGLLAKL